LYIKNIYKKWECLYLYLYIKKMSQYVDPENQKMLWEIINTNPYLTQIFANYHPSQKADWFKNVIESFYKKSPNADLSKSELHQWNKDTLAYMIQMTQNVPSLGNQHLESENTSPIYRGQSPLQQLPQTPRPQFISERERGGGGGGGGTGGGGGGADRVPLEYKPLYDSKRPEPIDFKENMKDDKVSNMDELIQKHIREREQELQSQSMPPPPPQQETTPPNKKDLGTGAGTETGAELLDPAATAELRKEINDFKQLFIVLIDEIRDLKNVMSKKYQ